MTPLELAITAALLCGISGIPGLSSRVPLFMGRRISYSIISVAAITGLAAATSAILRDGRSESIEIAWQTPLGALLFRLDTLSAFFLLPILLVAFCISLYSCGYCATTHKNRGESLLTFYFGLSVSFIILLVLSAGGVTLLIFWEAMTISVFLAMCLEHSRQEVRGAGLQYLVAGHVAILALFIAFSLASRNGTTQFPEVGSIDPAHPVSLIIMLSALLGFGIKAGIMPLHVWLPTAHANAPSNISALMSGVVIKMGIYGLLRTLSFFSTPPLWWGILFLCLGAVSAVAGVLFAIGQHDIKRLLAYHSIENIGIIVIGIGVAIIGLSNGNRILFVLGMAGALLHVLNHALFKSLLFLGSGVVVHAMATREIDRLGGVSRILPVTSATFLVGAAAICGLPPLNGFVSEFLIYLGIFKGFGTSTGSTAAFLAMAAPALALTGGLALACFVKLYGAVFLGVPRSHLPPSHEHPAMSSAMAILAGACILIGVLPFLAVRLIEPVIAGIFPHQGELLPSVQTTAHLYGLSAIAAITILAIILLFAFFINRLRSTPIGVTGTWDCGYAAPSPTMQYTASSFAEMLVTVFNCILRPERSEPVITALFPEQSRFHSHVPEVVLDKGIMPFFSLVDQRLVFVRKLQNGKLNRYILYMFVALIVLLAISDFIK